jgi:hypothetical protein
MAIGPGSTGISPAVLIGSGRPVATYLGLRALPCRSPVSVGLSGAEGLQRCDREYRRADHRRQPP